MHSQKKWRNTWRIWRRSTGSMKNLHWRPTRWITSICLKSCPREAWMSTLNVESISTKLEEDILPVADQMAEEIETVEVNNEELAEMHDSFRESVEIKQDFARQLDEYVEAYLMSVRSNEELIELSQSFMENQKARDGIIEKTDDTDAVGEIDGLIEQINEN